MANRLMARPQALRQRKDLLTPFLATMALVAEEAKADDDWDVAAEAAYTAEVWALAHGGLDRGLRYLHNVDLTLEATGEKGTFFLYGLHNNATTLSESIVGDVQTISNIDNGEVYRLYEAWYEHRFNDGAVAVKAGLVDLNSMFDAIDPAGLFINASHGIGPDFSQSGDNGPSIFPSTSPAIAVTWALIENWQLLAGLFDAVPNDPDHPKRTKISLSEGALTVAEVNYHTDSGFRFGAGGWRYSRTSDALVEGVEAARNRGFYMIVSGPLASSEDGGMDAEFWVRYGRALDRVNEIDGYVGGGIHVTNFSSSRPNDEMGVAFGRASASDAFRQVGGPDVQGHEIDVELTYRYEVKEGIVLQPDAQYVFNTGLDRTIKDAFVVGLRLELAFGL